MVVDGKKVAEEIIETVRIDLKKLKENGIMPGVAIITLGPDTSWKTYVTQKIKLAERIGITARFINLEKPTEHGLLQTIGQLNNDNNIHGVIAQRPFPKHINKQKIIDAIDPKKDIDGFRQDSPFQTPVWLAVEKILQRISRFEKNQKGLFTEWLQEKNIVVVGKGETGGAPVIKGLENLDLSPHVVDSQTQNKEEILKNADIIISATGKRVVAAKDLKKGVILIGVGLNRGEDEKLHGDYDEKEIKDVASFYTPTPGGIGPLNLAFLFKNLIEAAKLV